MPYLPADWVHGDAPLPVDKLAPIAQYTLSVGDLTANLSNISARPVKSTARGYLYRAEYKGRQVALKALPLHESQMTGIRLTHRHALLDRWFHLRHPNVLELLGRCESGRRDFALVLPWADQGTVSMFLHEHPTAKRSPLVLDVVQGLRYLHSLLPGIVHGDVKASNVYIRSTGVACLSDFTQSSYAGDVNGDDWLACAQELRQIGEIWRWTAPERLNPELFSMTASSVLQPPLDVYSFGMLVYEIYTGRKPFYDKKPPSFARDIPAGKQPSRTGWYEEPLSTTMWDITEECWQTEWQKRPTTDQLIARLAAVVYSRSHFPLADGELRENVAFWSLRSAPDEEISESVPVPRTAV